MTIGGAIIIGTLGAILRYAVSDSISGVDLQTIGLILMIAGAIGLVAGLAIEIAGRNGRQRY